MNLSRNSRKDSLKPFFSCIIFTLLNLMIASHVQAQQSFQPSPGKSGYELQKSRSFLSKQNTSRFEENKGQVTGTDASKVKYTYKGDGLSIFLMQDGIAYQFTKIHYPEGYRQLEVSGRLQDQKKLDVLSKEIHTETYRMDVQLIGANIHAKVIAEDKSTDYVNYYNHNVLDVRGYSKVTYKDIYPEIDWVIYTSGDHIKYDFVVRPGGNPAQIRLRAKHVEELKPWANGDLSLTCSMGTITEHAPVSYQNKHPVTTHFDIDDDIISFTISPYNTSETLVIDPTLAWATYYGGSDEEYGDCCATDNTGMVYLSGRATSANNIASGGHQNTNGGGPRDAFLVKFNSTGVRQWATYYGGNGDDNGSSCCVDNTGSVYMAGNTTSTNNIASSGQQNTYGGGSRDAFLVKFNSNGIRQWATYYGGTLEDWGLFCKTDNSGAIYLPGTTASQNNIASGGYQNLYAGGVYDGFLVKFNSNGVRQWATYYGSFADDTGCGFAIDNTTGALYLAGETNSTSGIASGGHQNTYGGGQTDLYLVKFNSSGTRLWSTYYGGSEYEFIANTVTTYGTDVYLGGGTYSPNNIASVGAFQTTLYGTCDAFLVKFNSSGIRQWATYYGGNNLEGGRTCHADNSGSVFLAGETHSTNNIASGGYQGAFGGGSLDGYAVKFSAGGVRQWGSYYGGNGNDVIFSSATDGAGVLYIAGYTTSTGSIASGGHQNTYGGGTGDAFLAKFVDCPTISATKNLTICANQLPYTWNSIVVPAGGTGVAVYHTPSLVTGCDSATTLDLTVNPLITVTKNVSICAGQLPYIWNGFTLNAGGNGVAVHHTPSMVTGCDSATTLNLTVNPLVTVTKNIIICFNQLPYVWNGFTLNAGGTGIAVYHTPSLVTGCDSATTLNLTVNPLITVTKNIIICSNQLPYVWNGFTLNAGGTGVAVYHTPSLVTGCDSATTLNLTVNPLITVTKNISICVNQLPYVWNGFTLNAGGTGVAVYHTPSLVTGCDSATTLNLTVNPIITATKNITICASQLPYVWNSITVNTGGPGAAVYHTPSLVTGCDSVTTLNLTVNPLISVTKNITICANQLPYFWNNSTINASGPGVAVYHTPSLVTGCDSATTLNLTVNPLISVTKNITICADQLPYLWNNSTINASGPGVAVYHTPSLVTGCDSATTLNLTVNPLISVTKNITICADQLPYLWNNSTINASGPGVAVYHTPSLVTGCDSATTLNLTVNPLITVTKNITICANQLPYVWNSITVNTGGTGVAVYHTPSLITGCDSATTLNLTVLNIFNTTANATICYEALPYIWGTQSLNTSGTYVQTFSAISGCDSTVTLTLTVRPAPVTFLMDTTACGLLTLYGHTYYTNAHIEDTLNNVAGCDSIFRKLNITISSNTPVLKEIDTAGCDKVTFEGRDYFENITLTDTLTTISGCDSVARKVNIFVEPLELNLTATPQEVYKGESIHFETTANMPYTINAWSPYGWFSNQYIKDQTINALQSGTVMVWGQSQHGCMDSAMVPVKVYTVDHAVFIPNAFSPNGDGLNDIFRPNFNVEKGFYYIRFGVFNRWGQRVYQAANVEQAGWDGRFKGQMTDIGTYSYIIEIEFKDGEKRTFKGNVDLIR